MIIFICDKNNVLLIDISVWVFFEENKNFEIRDVNLNITAH